MRLPSFIPTHHPSPDTSILTFMPEANHLPLATTSTLSSTGLKIDFSPRLFPHADDLDLPSIVTLTEPGPAIHHDDPDTTPQEIAFYSTSKITEETPQHVASLSKKRDRYLGDQCERPHKRSKAPSGYSDIATDQIPVTPVCDVQDLAPKARCEEGDTRIPSNGTCRVVICPFCFNVFPQRNDAVKAHIADNHPQHIAEFLKKRRDVHQDPLAEFKKRAKNGEYCMTKVKNEGLAW